MVALEQRVIFDGRRVFRWALAVALLGWFGVALGFALARSVTYFGYLTAFAFVTSLALGGLILLMTTYVVNASWNVVVRRLNEVIVSPFPLLALSFVPIAFGLDALYVWANPSAELELHAAQLLQHKRPYLNAPFFIARSCFYFALWTLVALQLRRWSLARDKPGSGTPAEKSRERTFSSALLPLVCLALTFAAFDWLMSLQPCWHSTIFGVYYFAGGFVASFGLLALLAYWVQRQGSAGGLIKGPHFHAIGRLMFAFTIFWAYNAFFQAMLIQIADRPEESEFYVRRLEHGWDRVLWLLVIGRFVLPFLLLITRPIKFRGKAMAALGAWIIAGQYLDMFWLVVPLRSDAGPLFTIWDAASLAALAGSAVAYAAWQQRGKAIVPIGDPQLERSIQYRSPL